MNEVVQFPKTPDNRSEMEILLDNGVLETYWNDLTDDEKLAKYFDWRFWARKDQLPPPGDWKIWMLMAGRGFGKTRVICETIRTWKDTLKRTSMIGPTADDVNNTLIEGESGILETCPPDERPKWLKSQRKLVWPNGAETLLFSADAPERLRGKQHMAVACDEIAAWGVSGAGGEMGATTLSEGASAAYTFKMMEYGLRLEGVDGYKPRVAIATTPRPIPLLQELMDRKGTVIVRGSTMVNKLNLSEGFTEMLEENYAGTRLGRQELYGELLMDFPGGLFPAEVMQRMENGPPVPEHFDRIVVGCDPSGASDKKVAHDAIGIVVVGMKLIGRVKHYWVLTDGTMTGGPQAWGTAVCRAYYQHEADRVVAEINYGGAMVTSTIHNIDGEVPVKEVTASRGKVQRMEPVAAIAEQGRLFFAQPMIELKKQLEAFTMTGYLGKGSPDRADSFAWAVSDMMGGSIAKRRVIGGGTQKSYWKPGTS